MSQYINMEGQLIPVTALEVGPCVVTDLLTPEKNGYKAIQIGYGDLKITFDLNVLWMGGLSLSPCSY